MRFFLCSCCNEVLRPEGRKRLDTCNRIENIIINLGQENVSRRWLKSNNHMRQFVLLLIITVAACLQPAWAGAKRALLIGVSSYQAHSHAQLDWNNIHGANDVALVAATLKRQGFAVDMLTNRHATARAIRRALARLASQTRAGDLVYIHFSGHGQPYEDTNNDESDGWDEAIVPYDAGRRYIKGVYEGRNHIVDDEMNRYITKVRKRAGRRGFVYFVLDACHIGGYSRGQDQRGDSIVMRGADTGFSPSGKPYVPLIDKRPLVRMTRGRNMAGACYVEACRAYQVNYELRVGNTYYGALSYYVNQVLKRHRLTPDCSWVNQVGKAMSADRRLVNQNMVVERSVR